MKIIRQLFEIILRKRQPQDLDYDLNAAVISLICSIGIGYLVYSSLPQISQPFIYNVGMTCLQALGIYGFLSINKKATRFIQTITAIFGTTVILQILTIGIGKIEILAIFGFAITMWNLILAIFIIRSALECSTVKAVFITLGYHLFMGIMMATLFPKFPVELQSIIEAANNAALSKGT